MQPGKISSYDLQKNLDSFYYQIAGKRWDYVTRVFHNQEQIVRCQLRDGTSVPNGYIKYWNMDGTPAAQFTVGSGGLAYTNILDTTWLNNDDKLCYACMYNSGAGLGSSGYSVVRALPDGASPEVLIKNINTSYVTTWSGASVSGYVGLTASDDNLFLKIGPELHKIDYTVFSGTPWLWSDLVSQGHVTTLSNAFHYGDGTRCYNLMYQPDDDHGYVLYSWHDQAIDVVYLRSISTSGTMAYEPARWAMLDIAEYSSIRYPFFLNQLDPHALHVLKVSSTTVVSGSTVTQTPAYLNVFNIDTTLASFLNVNSSDAVMPAGIGATADIVARVTNCWGTTLSGKLVQAWVSSGDGGVYPSYGYTDAYGRVTFEFTTGANVGISNVAVVVNEV